MGEGVVREGNSGGGGGGGGGSGGGHGTCYFFTINAKDISLWNIGIS